MNKYSVKLNVNFLLWANNEKEAKYEFFNELFLGVSFESSYASQEIEEALDEYITVERDEEVDKPSDTAMKLPKIPIDYSKAGTGQAPFDGVEVLGLDYMGDIMAISYCNFSNSWETTGGLSFHLSRFTSYTPMPEFFEQKGGEQ